jgi:hypothetical protein
MQIVDRIGRQAELGKNDEIDALGVGAPPQLEALASTSPTDPSGVAAATRARPWSWKA